MKKKSTVYAAPEIDYDMVADSMILCASTEGYEEDDSPNPWERV